MFSRWIFILTNLNFNLTHGPLNNLHKQLLNVMHLNSCFLNLAWPQLVNLNCRKLAFVLFYLSLNKQTPYLKSAQLLRWYVLLSVHVVLSRVLNDFFQLQPPNNGFPERSLIIVLLCCISNFGSGRGGERGYKREWIMVEFDQAAGCCGIWYNYSVKTKDC